MRVVLIGVSGSGKTTIGLGVAAGLGVPFLDADALHTPGCVEQMRSGTPLTDAERDAWFGRVLAALAERPDVVLACSALRRAHRDRMRELGDVRMLLLEVPPEELRSRLQHRSGHFFGAGMLDGQLATFDRPAPDEGIDVIDAAGPPAAVIESALAALAPSP